MSDSLPARRPIVRPNFDPKEQPWQVADSGLLRVNPELLTPDALRGALRPAREWTLDPLGTEKTAIRAAKGRRCWPPC